jgi:2-C-methyl-D-erythritol 4-phosphate cytidylyltransferase
MNIAIIVAAGRGYRLGGPLPKQYLTLGGEPILRRTIMAFASHEQIDAVQVIIHPADAALYAGATQGLPKLKSVQFGGDTRQESVRRGLESIAKLGPKKVLIHDAVRPFVTPDTIAAVLAALAHETSAIVGVPLTDTLKRVENGIITATVPRQDFYRAQTPQGFRFDDILKAHRNAAIAKTSAGAAIEFTDDAMIAEWAKLKVRMIEGTENNFKITTQADLARAELMLSSGAFPPAGSPPPARS